MQYTPEKNAPMDVTVIDHDGNETVRRAAECRGSSAKYPLYKPCVRVAGALTCGKTGDADAILCDTLLCTEVLRLTRHMIRGKAAPLL